MSPAPERHRVLRIGAAMLLLGLAGGFVGGIRWNEHRVQAQQRYTEAIVISGNQWESTDEQARASGTPPSFACLNLGSEYGRKAEAARLEARIRALGGFVGAVSR